MQLVETMTTHSYAIRLIMAETMTKALILARRDALIDFDDTIFQ